MKKKLICGIAASLLIAVVIVLACLWRVQYVEEKAEGEAAQLVWQHLQRQDTLKLVDPGRRMTLRWYTGPLKGGRGIILTNNDAAFWLKDDELFTVNSAARKLLPEHKHAPPEITYMEVRAVAD